MSFANLSVPVFLLGLLGLAAVLFLLQRLRVKYRDLPVVTTLFWKQAVEETRARVLVRRFRHPWAYVLALAIATLVWIAFAEPRWNQDDDGDYVLLLDASAGMTWGNQFLSTVDLLRKEAERLPADRRRVYVCGPDVRLVLERGEEGFLLEPRLKMVSPEASPSALGRQIRALVETTDGASMNILLFGDGPVSQSVLNALPANVVVKRVRSEESPSLRNNIGIAGIGISAAASGSYDRVDAMIRLSGDVEGAEFAVSLGGNRLTQSVVAEEGAYYLRDLPARGESLEVLINGNDALEIDNAARIVLPRRSPIPVAVADDIPEIATVVEVNAAFESANAATAQVTVGTAPDASVPSLVITAGNSILVTYENTLAPVEVEELAARFASAGLERVGRKLRLEGSEAFRLAVQMRSGDRRKIEVGRELLGDDYDFTESSSFPVFVSEALLMLAGEEPLRPFAIAGERLPVARDLAIAGASYAPPRAGSYTVANGTSLEVSLGGLAESGADAVPVIAGAVDGRRWPGIVTWCLFLALALLFGEWWFYQKGRIP